MRRPLIAVVQGGGVGASVEKYVLPGICTVHPILLESREYSHRFFFFFKVRPHLIALLLRAWGGGVLMCFLPCLIWPLATHPFRDGNPPIGEGGGGVIWKSGASATAVGSFEFGVPKLRLCLTLY